MSDQEFQELLSAIRRFDEEHSTSEKARKVLQDEGVLTETGVIADHYAKDAA